MLEFQHQKWPLIKCSPAKTTPIYKRTLECLGLKLLPENVLFSSSLWGMDGGVNPLGCLYPTLILFIVKIAMDWVVPAFSFRGLDSPTYFIICTARGCPHISMLPMLVKTKI